jgi:SNF2 family DNA or RNA helicase
MFTGTLRPFQAEAVDRAQDRGRLLIAYQMGLGKTVVTICAVEELVECKRVETGLVVVPASLKYQWAREIEKFTGDDNYIVIDGTPQQRAEQYERARRLRPRYVILNYEKVRDEWPVVSRLRRDYVVTDEATVYKGFTSKLSKRIKRLQPDEGYAFALTGQPVENRPEELFSIMQWVDEDLLGRYDIFDKTFMRRTTSGKVVKVKNLPLLWDLLGDAMVRKTRHDPEVAPYMPQVEESTIPVELDRVTAKVYRVIAADLMDDLEEALSYAGSFDLFAHYGGGGDADSNALRGKIMSKLTALRMLCDHPDLVRLSAKLYADDNTDAGSEYAYEIVKERGLLETVTRTPKMTAFLEAALLNLEESPKTKIVTFSSFKPTLYWLRDAFLEHNRKSVQFNGDMTARQKDTAKQKFADDPFCRVFLSSDAGGYGVDLPNANYLKNYDLPWSAGKLEQRNARIIRLSSEFDKVHVENWVIRGSVQERQYDMLQEKAAIASAMVDRKGASTKGELTLGLDTLREFLAKTDV